jgi:hypothetical protein
LHWTGNPDNPLISPNDSTEQENHFLMIIPYRGVWIMLYEYGWYLPNRVGRTIRETLYGDIRLAVSRDGVHYTRIEPSQQVIPLGPPGAWDAGWIVTAQEAVIKDGTIYLYYCGNGQECGGLRRRLLVRPCRMGLATLKLDRFTALETCDGTSHGHAITEPIAVRDAARVELIVNVSDTIPQRSWIEVEVIDAASSQTIAGYAMHDCVPIEVDGISVPVAWKGNRTLKDVRSERVQLRFQLYGGVKLHSFGFRTAG